MIVKMTQPDFAHILTQGKTQIYWRWMNINLHQFENEIWLKYKQFCQQSIWNYLNLKE